MSNHPISFYQETSIETASRGDILLALYDAAIRFVGMAKHAIINQDILGKSKAIGSTISILVMLSSTLNPKYSPDLCANLKSLYIYFLRRLQHGGASMDAAPLDEVLMHLQNLRDTWAQAIEKARLESPEVSA